MSLTIKAKTFAYNAHEGQSRKYTGEPYINHPVSVANVLREYYPDATKEMIAAALLHDTVEDTEATINDIKIKFGEKVAEIVEGLTDISKPTDGNRATRKAIDREHSKNACYESQIVKCADLIDNTSSIVEYDKDFAKVYLKEKRLLLDAMRDNVKTLPIWIAANKLCNESDLTSV